MIQVPAETRYSPSLLKNAGACLKQAYYRLTKTPAREVDFIQFGTDMHNLLENFLLDKELPQVDDEQSWLFTLMFEELTTLKEQAETIEGWFNWDKDGFKAVGRPDLVLKNGWIIDWKFPKAPWNETRVLDYEDSAYWYMWIVGQYRETKGVKFYTMSRKPARLEKWPIVWKQDRAEQLWNKWQVMVVKIEQAKMLKQWPATGNRMNCNMCLYNHICEDRR